MMYRYLLGIGGDYGSVYHIDAHGEEHEVTSAPLDDLPAAIREYRDAGCGMTDAEAERLIDEADAAR